ncbi:MAG TPA: ATP-binding protein [Nocardioidaceae bacterium]|nr:ATP-binding protein [Nocardioidaceae bacterium]
MHAVTGEAVDWSSANQAYVTAALRVLRLRVLQHAESGYDEEKVARAERARAAAANALPGPAGIDTVVQAFGLSTFERDLLLLCAGVEMDTAVADACAAAHGDPTRRYVTFGLGLAALSAPHWSAITPAAPLRRWHLVEVVHTDTPTTSPLRVDERVLHTLAGISYLDQRVEPLAVLLHPPAALPASAHDAVRRVVACWEQPSRRSTIQLHGRPTADLLDVAASAAHALGLGALRVRTSDLAGPAHERQFLARILERDAALSGLAIVLEVDDVLPEGVRLALDLAVRLDCPGVLTAREPLAVADPRPAPIQVRAPTASESRSLWESSLGPGSRRLGGRLDRVIGQFELDVDSIRTVAAQVRPVLDQERADTEAIGRQLWDDCRTRVRPALDGLTQRIEPRAGWPDIVLPEPQLRTLHQIGLHVRHRLVVHEEWGFAARSARGLGTAALFSGPSGTGKTLAAEVLATDLGLDLYRVDLSQVVSKYIGETEKNLRVVFDAAEGGGAVLLFDEADALFGRRSEVKDSHDRYANIEVSYLLQRMEAYRGLAILTTNLKNALDPAFMRRLRFVVQFPFPEAAQRAEIWRHSFPGATPTSGLDPRRLASLTVSGGTIANIALLAAFLAADAGEPVGMAHVLSAARAEYAKLERPLTDAEVRGWVG